MLLNKDLSFSITKSSIPENRGNFDSAIISLMALTRERRDIHHCVECNDEVYSVEVCVATFKPLPYLSKCTAMLMNSILPSCKHLSLHC